MSTVILKVAFVIPSFNMGGLETSMLRIASHFKASGCSVSMITTDHPGRWFSRIAEHGFEGIHIGGLHRFNFLPHAYRVGHHLRDAAYDVIFIVFDRYAQSALGLLEDSQAVVVPLLRNDHPEVYEIGLGNAERWNVAVGNSPRICRTAQSLRPNKTIVLIPNGVQCLNPSANARNWATGQRIQTLFVGRLTQESKRVLLLPTVLRRCVDRGLDVQLTIAGDGPDRSALEAALQQQGLDDRVSMLGYTSPDDLIALYQHSHILFFPSAYEGLPNVLLESQAYGCVPIATRLDAITDYVVRDGITGCLVPLDDSEAFVNAVETICNDPSKAKAMSLAATTWVRENFSHELESRRFLELIHQARAGQYPLRRNRSNRLIIVSMFPPRFLYRRIIKPVLAPPYLKLKRFWKSSIMRIDSC